DVDKFHGVHSRFWICSRIFSISAFISTTIRVMSRSWHLEPMVLASRLSSWVKKSSLRPTGWPLPRIARYWAMWLRSRTVSSSTAVLSPKMAASVRTRASSMERSSRITFSRSYRRWVYFSTRPAVSSSTRPTMASTASRRPAHQAAARIQRAADAGHHLFALDAPQLHEVLHSLGGHRRHVRPQPLLVHFGLAGHQHVGEPGQQARRHVVFHPQGLGHIPQ